MCYPDEAQIFDNYSGLTSALSKTRVLQNLLNCFLSTAPALSALVLPSPSSEEGTPTSLDAKLLNCIALIGPRIQTTLLQLNKLSKNVKNKS